MMSESSRRTFLKMAGAGAAAAGVAAIATPAVAAVPDRAAPDAPDLVAHISDPSTGEVSLLVGDREVVVHDHRLVARLTRAAAKGK
jgi:anaerobic selenocysteine-containing dehydrogenase